MPIEFADALKTPDVPAGTVPPPPAARGLNIQEVLAAQPKPASLGSKLRDVAIEGGKKLEGMKPGVEKAKGKIQEEIQPSLDAAVAGYRQAVAQYKEDFADPSAEAEPLHGLKTAMDLLNIGIAPLLEAGRAAIVAPIQRGLDRAGALLARAASPDEAKKKGIDWAIHKRDILNTVNATDTALDFAYDLGTMFIPGPGLKGAKALATPEQAAAKARVALRDVTESTRAADSIPPEVKPAAVTAALDKTMGFSRVANIEGERLTKLPDQTVIPAGQIIDRMLPHAEGYAKSFLTKLAEHMDKNVPVMFSRRLPGYLGVYKPEIHQIEVLTGEQAAHIVQTTTHEIVHSATVNMMEDFLDRDIKAKKAELGRDLTLPETMHVVNNPSAPIMKELDQIIAEARLRAKRAGRDFYGLRGASVRQDFYGARTAMAFNRMSPRHEFVAELFSNSEFQEFLANSEKYASIGYKWKNMLNQLGMLIGRHLGLKGPHELQLLNQSMKVGTQLIKLQAEHKPPHHSISQIVAREGDAVITRGDIERATPVIGKPVDNAAVRKAKSSLAISVEQIIRAVSPESLGRNAKLAAATIASRITELEQRTSAWHAGSKTRANFWRARPDMTAEFIERFEKGQGFSDSILQRIANHYRAWGKRIADQDAKTGLSYEPRENYLYHVFEDSSGVAEYFTRKYGSKWGDPGFIKDRSFDLYKEAIAAGFRPRFSNPEDIMLARQHASDLAEMHTNILQDFERFGLATRKVVGGERIVRDIDPEGKVSFRVEKTEGTKQPEGSVRWRAPNGEVYWIDQHADAVMQNAFKSFSLWGDKGIAGIGFRGMMSLKNAVVPIRLALSLFHPLHVAGIDMAAGYTRAMAEMLSGQINPIHGFGKMLRASFGPVFENPKAGWRVMKAWKGQIPTSKLTTADAQALKILIETGVAPEMSVQYRTNARQNFANALRDAMAEMRQIRPLHAAGDVVKATWHAPWAVLSAMGAPVFEAWIPSLKAASAIKDAKSLLARNPELLENDAARLLAMRRIGKSVDNRYGEMAYNKLFWKRWMKDIAVLDTLSLGWQLGFIREYGGGMLDLGQWAKGSDKIGRIRKGEMDKVLFVSAYTALGAGVAGLMTWAMTGEQPTGLDYISPRTGEKNPDGSDQRVTTMFYSREFASLYKHIQNEGMVSGVSELALNKGSGLFGLMHEWATGVNGFGQKIRDPESDAFTKLEQTLAYTMADIEPISMRSMQEQITDRPEKMGVLSAMGFTPAPKYLTESVTTAHIKQAFRSYVAPRETPFERAEYSKEYTQLRQAYQSGADSYGEKLDGMVEKFQLSGDDQRRLIRSLNSTLPSEVRMFSRLPWEEQIKILNKASPEEVDLLLPHSNKKHVRNTWTPPEEQ